MSLVRRVAFAALVFLPACGGCSSCFDPDKADLPEKDPSNLANQPRSRPAPDDTGPGRFIRAPAFRRRRDGGGLPAPSGVASDAAIE